MINQFDSTIYNILLLRMTWFKDKCSCYNQSSRYLKWENNYFFKQFIKAL